MARWPLKLAACAALLCGGASGAEPPEGAVRISGGACGADVTVHAQDASLSEVLRQFAKGTGAQLSEKVLLADRVSLDLTGPPESVLKRLMQGHNLVVETGKARGCRGRESVTKIWVLPAGEDSARASTAPPKLRGSGKGMTPEEWRRARREERAKKASAEQPNPQE
jgi:hypothetical protein